MQQLCTVLELPPVSPFEKLCTLKSQLFGFARDLFPSLAKDPTPVAWTTLTYPDGTQVRVQVQPETTVIELFQAELALSQDATSDQWIDASTGNQLDYSTCVAGLTILVKGDRHSASASSSGLPPWTSDVTPIPVLFEDPEQEDTLEDTEVPPVISETAAERWLAPVPSVGLGLEVASTASADPGHIMDALPGLRHLSGAQLVALVPPLVSDVSSCAMFRRTVVSLEARLAVLANEELAMGDDELNLHLMACIKLSGRTDVQYLDPLLAGSWLQSGTVDCVREWMANTLVFP